MKDVNSNFLLAIPGEEDAFGSLSDSARLELERLEDELMKRGTLGAESIDWSQVKQSSMTVLASCSHLLAFRGLFFALSEGEEETDRLAALQLADQLFSSHYPKLHPQGAKQARKRKAWAKEIVSQIESVLNSLSRHDIDDETSVEDLVSVLRENLETHDFDVSGLRVRIQAPNENAPNRSSSASESKQNAQAEDTYESNRLSAKDRAQLRRDIDALAERIFAYDPDAGVAYAMRGYASWLELQFAPEADQEGLTAQHSMPSSIASAHEGDLDEPTLAKLLKLERKLATSPDWFEGQHWLAQMAKTLGLLNAADAIRSRCLHRLETWPAYNDLKYSNGRPIVPDEVRSWLQASQYVAEVANDDASSSSDKVGWDEILRDLDNRLVNARSLREQSILKHEFARELRQQGYPAQSRLLLTELLERIKHSTAQDWDEAFVKEIEHDLSDLE